MTRRSMLLSAPIALALLSVPPAERTAAAESAPGARYRALEFLVGSCWIGPFPDGKSTDEHCFEWIYDRKFVRDRHVVRGAKTPYEGETIFAWDAKSQRVVFWYLNNQGGLSTGTVEQSDEGLVFPERHTTEAGVREMKAVWTRTGPDSYRVSQAERVGGEWKTLWTMDLKRKR
jgi:hypothetical protein